MSSVSNGVGNFNVSHYSKLAYQASSEKVGVKNTAETKTEEKNQGQVLKVSPGKSLEIHATYDNRKVYDVLDLKNTAGLEEMLKAMQEMNQLHEDTAATEAPKTKPSLWKQGTESDKSYFTRLASYLGLNSTNSAEETETSSEINTKADFLETLRKAIKSDGKELQTRVDSVLKKNKIQLGKQDRISFQLDSKGELVINGVRDKKMLAKIRNAINSDPKLAEELKTLAAKQKVYNGVQDNNLASVMESSAATRSQLTKNYLKGQGNYNLESLELDKTDPKNRSLIIEDEKFQAVVDLIPGLDDELVYLLDEENRKQEVGQETFELVEKTSKNQAKEEVDFAYKNGVIMNDTIFDKEIVDSLLKRLAMDVIPIQVDGEGKPLPESQQLRNYTVVMQADGRFRIESVNNNIKAEEQDVAYLMEKANEHFLESSRNGTAQEAVEDILMKHQYDYGDVTPTHVGDQEASPHEVRFSVATGPSENLYEITSQGAESAAEGNLQKAVVEFSTSFTNYVGNSFKHMNPNMDAVEMDRILSENLPIGLNQEGDIRFDSSEMENKEYAKIVDKAVGFLNERINSDDLLADENFENQGDDELVEILKVMMDIKHNLDHLSISERKNFPK